MFVNLTVQELIEQLMKVEDKTKVVEIPEFGTFDQYCDIVEIEETKETVKLVG